MGADRAEDSGNPLGGGSVSSVLATQLSDLARELQQEDDVTAVLSAIVDAALDLIPGTAHASISLVTGRKKVDSQVASGDLARQVDALQNSTGQGPCLDAAYKERVVRVPDLSREDHWPKSTATARTRLAAIPSRSGFLSPRTPPWLSRTRRRSISSMKP